MMNMRCVIVALVVALLATCVVADTRARLGAMATKPDDMQDNTPAVDASDSTDASAPEGAEEDSPDDNEGSDGMRSDGDASGAE